MKEKEYLPLLHIKYSYELHVHTKTIKRAEERIAKGVKVLCDTETGDFGFEKNVKNPKLIEIIFGLGSFKLEKKHLNKAIKRYQRNFC